MAAREDLWPDELGAFNNHSRTASPAFAKGLAHLILPDGAKSLDLAGGEAVSDTSTSVFGARGPSRRFARASTQILTLNSRGRFSGYSSASGFIFLKMDNLNNGSADTFISCRTAGNAGFVWGVAASTPAGSFPNRTFRHGFVINGVAAYTGSVTQSGFDTEWGCLGFTAKSSGTVRFFANGQFVEAVAIGVFSNPGTQNTVIGTQAPAGSANTYLDADVAIAAAWANRELSDAEHKTLWENPLALLEPRRVWVPVSSGGVTGTLATTNANDTSAASGTTTVTGTLARTNADDTSAASGTTTVVGTLATTNADDTSSASGSVGGDVTGTVAYTNANDTSAASGTTTVTGTLAKTNADDSVSAAGWAGTITGTVDATNGNDTSSASGFVGSAAATTQSGGGRSKRKRQPVVVEIDGEDFIVESEEEAQALLDKAKETAEENAKLAIERASKAKKRSPGKILRDARRQLDVPTIKAPGYEDIAREVQAQIRDTYASTIRTIEIQALLNRAQQQEEDDEDILMLIA